MLPRFSAISHPALLAALMTVFALPASAHPDVPLASGLQEEAEDSTPEPETEEPATEENEAAGETSDWDVANPPLETRDVTLDVDEGTWMSLDVSPDGQTVVFDLLGDIYTLNIGGGAARNIASGLPWEYQPRFSPDGSKIAFTSDRGGGDNIWIMNPDGSDKAQITKESFRLLNNATWSADGRFIAARKHFTTGRSLGTGEIWLYHLGGGKGVQLVERPNENFQKELGEPIFSPDGEHIYYSFNTTPGNTFIYAQDSNTELFAIRRYTLETGEIETIADGPGGAVRPTPSPDGRYLAFVRRERTKSKLYLKDLQSGEERKIYDALDQDMQETWGVQGIYPNMDWLPDSKTIVFWAGGKIRKLNIENGEAEVIPFRVRDTRDVIDPPRPTADVAPDEFTTKMSRFAALSPNGRQVVFESLGKLYIKPASGGEARRLTTQNDAFELFPAWSRDGSQIAFVTWDDDALGKVMTVSANGRSLREITPEPGHYRRPHFSPDGEAIVYEKDQGGFLTAPEWSEAPGIYRIPAAGGAPARVARSGGRPHFGAENDRIYMTGREGDAQALISVDLNGEGRRVHAKGALVTAFYVAPDGRHMAFQENYQAHVMPVLPGPQEIASNRSASGLPVAKASGDGADYLNWSADGAQLNWSLGPVLYSAAVADMLPALPAPADAEKNDGASEYTPPTEGISLARTVDAEKPEGKIALVGARIITMTGDDGGAIENGTVLIDGNRIIEVGPRDEVDVPSDTRVVDLRDKVIIPGLIDAHAHGSQGVDDIIPEQNWLALAHLAFGVTTVHDPSNDASQFFGAAEMQRAGIILGPRMYSTGEIVYGAKSPRVYAVIDSYEDALEHVRRLKAQGAFSIKNYNQPRRDQRQQVVAASLAENIPVFAEGGSLYHMDMAIVADGNTGLEHNLPQARLYEDVLSFYGQTEVGYTPTVAVTYGGLAGDPYWRFKTDVWKHPILSRHVPPRQLQARSVRRTMAPEDEFVDAVSGATSKQLMERGVPVSIGAHGEEEGLAAHWEMWSFARGGMSPLQALRTATTEPARHLGLDRDLGTLEVGKLADLVILTADPLTDIRNSDKIHRVMLNGRLYNPSTMDEVVTGSRKRSPYFWE